MNAQQIQAYARLDHARMVAFDTGLIVTAIATLTALALVLIGG